MSSNAGGLLALIDAYRGRRGDLRKAMGAEGLRILWMVCDGSPTTAAEWLGYDPKTYRSNITKLWARCGLQVNRREPTDAAGADGMTAAEWRSIMLRRSGEQEEAPVFEWDVPRGHEYVPLIGISCLHYGSPDMDYARWIALRDWIKATPEARWVGLGDFFERMMKDDVGGLAIGAPPLWEELAAEDIEPIADQCFGLCAGNHEMRLARRMGYDDNPVKHLAKELGVHYYGIDGFLRLKLSKAGTKQAQQYDGRLHHGWGSARTPGGQVNKLRDLWMTFDGDFGLMGHTHTSIVNEFRRWRIDEEDHVTTQGMPFSLCGTFKKSGPGSYDRAMGYAPSALGAGTVHLYVTRHAAHARS